MSIKFVSPIPSYIIFLLSFLFVSPGLMAAEDPQNTDLKATINRISTAFEQDDTLAFNRLVPLRDVQQFHASVVKEGLKRVSGKSLLISRSRNRALVMLCGILLYGNSGDETGYAGNYTGLYEFEKSAGFWQLKSRIEIDRANQLKKHALLLAIQPGKGISVKDTLTIHVLDDAGFAVRLNHRARLDKVLLNQKEVRYNFSGGLLWVEADKAKDQQLLLEYSLEVEKDEQNTNSAFFGSEFGHLRNQYFWHPFFSFSSPHDRADFRLHCTIPKDYQVATSLVQQDRLEGDLRLITASSESPTFGLSIYYDQKWEIARLRKGDLNLVLYATSDFSPAKDMLFAEFSKNMDMLQSNFGKPVSKYFGIVQDRSASNGWKNRSNNIIVAGSKGGEFNTDKPSPRASFGHEVAHGWTSPSGPATNFLMEGWATYTESILLSSVYGDSILSKFFASQKQNYIKAGFNGSVSLWEDYGNNGVSYSKGSWLFYMLANQLSRKGLSEAMYNFIQSGNQSIYSFMQEMSKVSGRNLEPQILSWLKSREIPNLQIEVVAGSLRICQTGDVFIFPLEIEVWLKDGTTYTEVVSVVSRETLLKLPAAVDKYLLDPDHKILLSMN